MAERRIIKSRNKEVYPVTHEECVVDNNATSISERFQTKGSITIPNEINALETKIGSDGSSHSLITQLNAIGGRYAEIVAELVEILQSLGVEPTSEDLDAILEEVKSYSASNIPKFSKFIRMTMIPNNVRYAGVVIVNDILRVIGGYTTSAQKTNYSYTLSNNSHVTMKAMSATRYYINACYLKDGRICIPGGYTTSAQKTNYGYLVGSDSWSTRASMPASTYGNDVFTFDKSVMYSAGGYNCNKIYTYDCTANSWTTLSVTLPSIRYRGSYALVGNQAYIIGGIGSSGSTTQVCYCFDNLTKTVSTKASAPSVVSDCSSVYIKGKIFLFGNQGVNETILKTIHIYDPVLNSWSTSSDTLPVPMTGSRAVSYNDDVAIIQCGRYVYLYRP